MMLRELRPDAMNQLSLITDSIESADTSVASWREFSRHIRFIAKAFPTRSSRNTRLFASLVGDPSAFSNGNSEAVAAGIGALQNIFASACLGAPLDPKTIRTAGETVI
jgi:hypothetical protein